MSDPVIHLPQDIFSDQKELEEGIVFYDYTAQPTALKGKSILVMNSISLVMQGEKTMHFASKTVHANAGSFHFLSAGHCVASMDLLGKQNFRSILIFFNDKVLADNYIKHQARIRRLKSTSEPEGYLSFKKDAFVHNYIHSLELLLHAGGRLSQEMKLLKFEELMLYLLEHYPKQVLAFRPSASHPAHLQIRQVVETNITNQLTIEELAFLCHLSPSTFKRRFAEVYGSAPNKWMQQRRLALAKELLSRHREKPGEVYYKVGYENHSSFSQAFRQCFGLTPKEFQHQQLALQP